MTKTGGGGCIVEGAIPNVLIERVTLVGEVGHHNVRPAIIIVVGEVDPHAGVSAAIHVHRHLRNKPKLFERPVTSAQLDHLPPLPG